MNEEREEIEKLKKEIKGLCVEVYGKSGDEIIELIERANSFYIFMPFCDENDTIGICHSFIKQILRDKKYINRHKRKLLY